MDLAAHLNELNMHLQGKNQFICAMFQTITAFEMKLKLWKVEVMRNNVICFDALAKHRPVNSRKDAALLFILIKEFENRFQDCKKSNCFLVSLQLHFSININTLLANFQMQCIELQPKI